MPKFNPTTSMEKPKAGFRFEVHHLDIPGSLGIRARMAAQKFNLKNNQFVIECIKYALDNMDIEC